MSYYPSNPTLDNVFNDTDFKGPDEIDANDENSGDINLEYLLKSGGKMTGTLDVPNIIINGTTQTSAFSSNDKIDIDANKTKLSNITKTTLHTEISDLKCQNIQFTNGIQNQAFTDNDKTKISENQGKLTPIINSISQFALDTSNDNKNIVINSGDGNISLESNEINLNGQVNTSSCVLFSNVGSIGCDPELNGDLVIATNDNNHVRIDSGFSKVIELKSSQINLGRMAIPAYIKFHNDMYINSASRNLIITTGTGYKTTFQNDVDIDTQITFNDGSIQTKAFTNDKNDNLVENTTKINKLTFNENNITIPSQLIVSENASNMVINGDNITFPDNSVQTTAYNGEHSGALALISSTNNVLNVTAESINLTDDFNNSYGQIGKNNSIQVELKSNNAQGIHLDCGGPSAGVNITGDKLTFNNGGSKIVMNGEEQNRCFTETLYQKVVNNPRISAHSNNLGWQFLNLSSAFAHSQRQETIIKTNIGWKLANTNLDPAELFFLTNGNWNKGEMLIQFKYGVNYKLTDCQITRLKSRIIIEGGTTYYTGMYTGTHYKDGQWTSNDQYINYGDSVIINMTDGAKLFIETDYDIQTSTTASGNFDLDCNIEIVQL
jgi:hypothetical protein